MSPRRLLYVFFTKCIVPICLSKKESKQKKKQSSTLGQMFSSSLLIALVYFCFFMFLVKVTTYLVLCSLFPRNCVFFYTVDTLSCFNQLLLAATEN